MLAVLLVGIRREGEFLDEDQKKLSFAESAL